MTVGSGECLTVDFSVGGQGHSVQLDKISRDHVIRQGAGELSGDFCAVLLLIVFNRKIGAQILCTAGSRVHEGDDNHRFDVVQPL